MMEKNTLWQWAFNLLSPNADTPEPRKPMAVPNSPARAIPLSKEQIEAIQDEWNEQCSSSVPAQRFRDISLQVQRERDRYFQNALADIRPAAGVAAGEPQRDLPATGSAREAQIRAGQTGLPSQAYPGPSGLVVGQADMRPVAWEPGIEHNQPHPVKENPDGTLYYKGCVYRKVGDHRRNKNTQKNTQKNKRRQG